MAPEDPSVSEIFLASLLFYYADREKLHRLSYTYSYDGSRDIVCRTSPDDDGHGLYRWEIDVSGWSALESVTCREGRTPPMTRLRITNKGTQTVNINAVKINAAGRIETNHHH